MPMCQPGMTSSQASKNYIIFLGVKVDQITIYDFISFNLFSVYPSLSLWHYFLKNEETVNLKSEYGPGEFKGIYACLASLSAALWGYFS